ncbi:MAG TPA: LamG domain-containing protein [Kofleriaceae bacterium]
MRLALAVVVSTGCAQLIHIPGYTGSDGNADDEDAGVSMADGKVAPSAYATAVLMDSPIGWYHLDDTDTNTALDAVNTTSPGTYKGEVTLGKPGAFTDSGTSVNFAGSDAGIDLGSNFDFLGRDAFTLEAWIRPTNFDGQYHDLGSRWHQPIGQSGYVWYQIGSDVGFERDVAGSGDNAGADNVFTLNQWSYVVATYDGTTMTIYVDGAVQGSTTSSRSLLEVTLSTMIGAANGSPTATPFNGDIDEYAIYDHALALDRIVAHFSAATGD